MQILCLSHDFPPDFGGIAVVLNNLCTQLCYLGHRVDVLAPKQERCTAADARQPYRVYRYESPQRFSSITPIYRTLTLYRQHSYDVIFIGHFMSTHALGVLLLRRLWGVPYVILSHGNDLRYSLHTKVDRWVARLLLNNATKMLGCSRFVVGLIRHAGYKGPAEILNPPVDLTKFHPGVDTNEIIQRFNLEERRVLITAARLVAKKNIDGVLLALPRVIEKVPDLLYLVVGDGEERQKLEKLTDELGLRHYVRFLGYIENSKLAALYCASNIFVMPSYEVEDTVDIETFGVSFIEANACGKPVIGGRAGGTKDAVVDGETGLLVDPHNIDEIAAAIIRLLTNRELAQQLGEHGRRRVERDLTMERVGHRLEHFLLTAISRTRV